MNQQQTQQTSHMAIWDKVCKTDPMHTRQVNQRGGYTAIDPTYQTMQATKQFGPYGSTWGLRSIEYDYALMDKGTGLVLIHAEFFYPGGSFPISNAINPTMGKSGVPDADFAKKVETNTISKALSRLGFNADVYLGQFEDQQYIEHRTQESQIEKAIDQDAERLNQTQAFESEIKELITRIEQAPTMGELQGLYILAIRKLKPKPDTINKPWTIKATKAKDSRKAELEAQQQEQETA
ncbi:hypothetical protein J3998_12075 [Thiomicrorhabdus sp. 6S2-11]|uniref:Uncharacterized protein n=1 Tax=Thiomicrorhabdus marina TaxID=2818442 RepID=A0ABS3Q7T0_9GAMM|nr:hypothetical protein [Thiomicrorhabdus marina]MBO1928311.1 hypothetical protein [Thiomicrorhabdus marina]